VAAVVWLQAQHSLTKVLGISLPVVPLAELPRRRLEFQPDYLGTGGVRGMCWPLSRGAVGGGGRRAGGQAGRVGGILIHGGTGR
jgi:hypothetical protein